MCDMCYMFKWVVTHAAWNRNTFCDATRLKGVVDAHKGALPWRLHNASSGPCLLQENMMRAFQHFDTDGSGTMSREELREALKVGYGCICHACV